MQEKQDLNDIKLVIKPDPICQTCGKHPRHSGRNSLVDWMSSWNSCKCATSAVSKAVSSSSEPTEHSLPANVCNAGDMVARHYQVIECLGSGGMSVVYKARHVLMDKIVAVKLLLPNAIPSQKMVLRMQQEAKAISRLRHENIVQVSEFGLDDKGLPYLVMDYVTGKALSNLIEKQEKLPLEDCFKITIQVASGLEHAHAEGIYHRDIKPDNIIITTENGKETAKIVDFGIAKLADNTSQNLTQTGELFGSPLYMSPEQCRGKNADHRSDIYSLGCVLYECIFGRPPFISDSRLTTMMMHISDKPQINEKICGAPLKVVLEKCLVKDLSLRYQSAAELKADLVHAQNGITPAKIASRLVREQLSAKQIVLAAVIAATIGSALIGSYILTATKAPEAEKEKQVMLPTPDQLKKYGYTSLGGTADDFAKGREPPHVVRPLSTAQADDAYAQADFFDNSTRQYFNNGQYEKAIPLLEFSAKTYKEGGRHYNNDPEIETVYLGGAHYHLAQCHQMLGHWDEAIVHYRECFRLYNKVKLKLALYEGAVSGYADVLEHIGKTDEADKMLQQYRDTGKVTKLF
jgi:serine/threonine protein kinase